MRRTILVLLLVLPTLGQAASLPVIDIGAITQAITQYRTMLQQYVEQLKQTQQGIDQIKNQMQQSQYAYDQVQQGIKNLQHLDINNAGSLWSLGQQLQDKLRQADLITYDASRAYGQAQQFYGKVSGMVSGPQLRQMQRQWAGVQREAGQVGVAVEAIRQQQADLMVRQRDLLNKAASAKGNLDIQQAQAQLQGLQSQQLHSIENQLATMGRAQAVQTLEEAVMKEATAAALEQASGTITISAQPAGRLFPLSK